ncbi:MAG: hypothetical protein QXO30_02520 [Candidatus Caldarchaeum sp.]
MIRKAVSELASKYLPTYFSLINTSNQNYTASQTHGKPWEKAMPCSDLWEQVCILCCVFLKLKRFKVDVEG